MQIPIIPLALKTTTRLSFVSCFSVSLFPTSTRTNILNIFPTQEIISKHYHTDPSSVQDCIYDFQELRYVSTPSTPPSSPIVTLHPSLVVSHCHPPPLPHLPLSPSTPPSSPIVTLHPSLVSHCHPPPLACPPLSPSTPPSSPIVTLHPSLVSHCQPSLSPPLPSPPLPSPLLPSQAVATVTRDDIGIEMLYEYYNQLKLVGARLLHPSLRHGIAFVWFVSLFPYGGVIN